MRRILTTTLGLLALSANIFAQNDFPTLDKQTYDYYLQGDYKNLRKVGSKMLTEGMDYYYLRMRMGILAYNNQKYATAATHFQKALEFNALDSISHEYIYLCYLLAGRNRDASNYLESIPENMKVARLKAINSPFISNINLGFSALDFSKKTVEENTMNYELTDKSYSIKTGLESNFSSHLKGTFAYTYFHRNGISYSELSTTGTSFDLSQNQLYTKLSYSFMQGWEIGAFGHLAFFTQSLNKPQQGNGKGKASIATDYIGGLSVAKSWWKIRTGVNLSVSNLGTSQQTRGEGYLTYLPSGNLNLYFTSGAMIQSDNIWGNTYQVNQEIGFKVSKFLWFEGGVISGNSYLFARSQGASVFNTFQVPTNTAYGNLIFLFGKHINLNASAFYNNYDIYSWNLTNNTRSSKITTSSLGGTITLTYKIF